MSKIGTEMSDTKLNPCPFCGLRPKFVKKHAYHIKCGCGAAMTGSRAGGKEYVLEKWNKRATKQGQTNIPDWATVRRTGKKLAGITLGGEVIQQMPGDV